MIKVAISGAEHPSAGELIRILVNHPDVEIVSLVAPGFEGKQVHSVHHGLLGEDPLFFTSLLKPSAIDLLFVNGEKLSREDILKLRENNSELKIIMVDNFSTESETEDSDGDTENPTPVFALPEINRKALVRGASIAAVPSAIASLALVPLYPLALNMLLSDDMTLEISAPEDMVTSEELEIAAKEISSQLSLAQRSFNGKVSFKINPPVSKRGIELHTSLPSPLDLEHILRTYDIYDDHNFSYAVTSNVKLEDVKGTEKIIVSLNLSKEGTLHIHAVADGRLRGSAGEAVHVMNLMFGLHEKTGLYLKPYAY